MKVYLILKYLFWNSYSIMHLLAKSLSPSCNLSSFTASSPVTTVNLESHCSGHPKIIKPSFNHNRINTLHTGSTVEHVEVDEVELDVWMKMHEEARLDVIVDEGVGKTTMMQGNSRSGMGVLAKGVLLSARVF